MKQYAFALMLGWFVVTYSGDKVAGPFTLLTDCQDMVKIMAAKFYNVSTVCQAK